MRSARFPDTAQRDVAGNFISAGTLLFHPKISAGVTLTTNSCFLAKAHQRGLVGFGRPGFVSSERYHGKQSIQHIRTLGLRVERSIAGGFASGTEGGVGLRLGQPGL